MGAAEVYPRVLDREGCLYGQGVGGRVEALDERMDRLEKKIDRLTWSLVSAAVGFGSAALMLGVNLWLR
jgi:hypothetical protein